MSSRLSLGGSIGLGVMGLLGFWSCTLTSDSFEPREVSSPLAPLSSVSPLSSEVPDAGGSDAGAPSPSVAAPSQEPSAPCSGRSEVAGCAVELLPGACLADADCESRHCREGACQPATCADGRLNQDESAVDCGGACARCADGEGCRGGSDCRSGACGANGECSAASCEDGVINGNEPVVDCGDASCGPCADGHACSGDAQCASELCEGGTCRPPPCADGERNGSETDVDCGGSDSECVRCGAGAGCGGDGDCRSGDCVAGVCSSCGDGERNGTETDVDCGGSCGPCQPGDACGGDADCESSTCQDGRCCGGTRVDCTRCARRLARVLSCNSNGPNGAAQCDAFLDCLADNEDACSVRYAPGCSDAPGDVCDHTAFGGNTGPGVALADAIIGTAGCTFGEE
jgi:hypothetical protein